MTSRKLVAREAADFTPWLGGHVLGGISPACDGVLVAWGTRDEATRRRFAHDPLGARFVRGAPVPWRVVLHDASGARVLEVESRLVPCEVQPWGDGVVLVDQNGDESYSDEIPNAEVFDSSGRAAGRFAAGLRPALVRSTPDRKLWVAKRDESMGRLDDLGLVAFDGTGHFASHDWGATPVGGFIDCEAVNVAGDGDVWALPYAAGVSYPLLHVTRDGFTFWPLGDAAGPAGIGLAWALAVRDGRVLAVVTDDEEMRDMDMTIPLRAREFAFGAGGAIRETGRHEIVDERGASLLGDGLMPSCLGGVGGTLYFRADELRVLALRDW